MRMLEDLLTQLAAAIEAGDRALAEALMRKAQQQLVLATHALDASERQLRTLEKALAESTPIIVGPSPVGDGNIVAETSTSKTKPNVTLKTNHIFGGKQETGTVYPVWFGTNRKPDGRGGFGTARHDRTTRGRADVRVPEGHRIGEIGSSRLQKLFRLDFRDDTLRIQQLSTLAHEAWLDELRQSFDAARKDGDAAHALVFLHGFNVTFEEAAIRAAQIGVDLGMPGATAFFSWPSRGNARDYPVDEATIEASEQAITDFLVDFSARSGADKIHLIAHSMGNRGLLRALQRIAANAETRGKVKFDQIFLAAPDVDRDLFMDLSRLYGEHAKRVTLYASDGDLPVHLSSKLHDAARAGYFRPYTLVAGVDTIAVPDFDLDLLEHSYFAQAGSLLSHMRELMLEGKARITANLLSPASDGGLAFWKLKR